MSTMREVAEQAGVSAKTVSRVLRNDRYVSDGVRQRVLSAAIDDLAVRAQHAGRELSHPAATPPSASRSPTSPTRSSHRSSTRSRSMARARRTAVIVTSLGYRPEFEQAAVDCAPPAAGSRADRVSRLARTSPTSPRGCRRTPMVFVDRAPTELTADCVIEDDARRRTHGHHAPARARAPAHRVRRRRAIAAPTTMQRLEGYTDDARRSRHHVRRGQLVYLGDTTFPTIDRVLTGFADLPEPPSAVFSSNARCTFGRLPRPTATGRRRPGHGQLRRLPDGRVTRSRP